MTNSLTLRYYAPHYQKTRDDEIRGLLDGIRAKHGITCEVRELPHRVEASGLFADNEDERKVYESDFLPRKQTLRNRIGTSLTKALRTNSGYFHVAGTVAVLQNGLVEWFTCYESCRTKFEPASDKEDDALAFLRSVEADGPAVLAKVCVVAEQKRNTNTEEQLVARLIASRLLDGHWEQEVRVGTQKQQIDVNGQRVTFDWRKRIDAVCRTAGDLWVIEAKRRLNYEAIGEVLTYSLLFKDQEPSASVKCGIVCEAINEELLIACTRLGITVFWAKEEGLERVGPENAVEPDVAASS